MSDYDNPPEYEESPYREFKITVSQTLHKTVGITTNNYYYTYEGKDEDDYPIECYDTTNTNWLEEYKIEHHSPLDLIKIFKRKMEVQLQWLKQNKPNDKWSIKDCEFLIDECSDWIEDELEAVEE